MVYADTGDWQRAATLFSALAASRTDEVGARAALQRGLAMEGLGRTAEAIDALVRLGAQFTGFDDIAAEALWNAWRIAVARGDDAHAASLDHLLRTRYPRSAWAELPTER